ncbi:MAG TPA: zf-HC2 domain-containing protein [Kofleriaceae bacterium]|nr:zf-HC2 domain-containing protein [Kofleriaceae bacterium]
MASAREPQIDCPELPHIHALADGELPPGEAARARRHLAWCARCRSELAFLMQLAAAIAPIRCSS